MMALIVTLEVFSGRPNPEWTLTPADSAEFERQLAALAPLAPAPAAPEQPLGYSGFSVRGRATPVQVFQGVVVNGAQALADPGRGLEHWLLNTGRGLLDPGLATYVDSEIASGP
jgi:hypothetical protein